MTSDVTVEVAEVVEAMLAERDRRSVVGDGWHQSSWDKLAAGGLTMVSVPEEAGGSGGSVVEAAAVIRAVGAAAGSLPLVESSLVAGVLLGHGGVALADAGVVTVATEGPARTCRDVPWGRHADTVLVVEADGAGLRLRVLERERLDWQPGTNLAGEPRDTGSYEPHEDDRIAALPADAGRQADLAAALGRSALIAGAIESMLALTARHVSERVQFGRPLSALQAVQQLLARLAGEAASAGSAVDAAVAAIDRDGIDSTRAEVAVPVAKIRTGQAARAAAAIAHELHGAIGLTEEYSLGALTMRAQAWAAEAGSERRWSDRLGRRLAVLGPEAAWTLLADSGSEGS